MADPRPHPLAVVADSTTPEAPEANAQGDSARSASRSQILPKAPTSDLEQAGSGERESIPASLPLSSFPGYADATPLPNGPASQAGIEGVQALSMLVGGVAHDLNNLLQVITATAQLLKIRAGNEESRSLLSEIIQATERAADLAHDLRDASRRARALAEKRQG